MRDTNRPLVVGSLIAVIGTTAIVLLRGYVLADILVLSSLCLCISVVQLILGRLNHGDTETQRRQNKEKQPARGGRCFRGGALHWRGGKALRRRAESQIQASEERFRVVFESMEEAFCIVEMIYDADHRPVDYRFLEANPTFEKHTGFKDAVGRTIRELVPDHDAHWFEIYGAVAATGEPNRFVNEAKAMGRWYDVYAYRVGGRGSDKVGILFTDITARKQADDDLRHMAEALSEADQRKDVFLATLAHELRNPLAPISTGLQLLRLAGNDSHTAEQARTMMERQLGQMVRLVDDLLDVSRITRGKLVLRKERLELTAVVSSAVETSSPLIEASGHELTVQLPDSPIYLEGDLTRLAQVFSNLLNNAAKYTKRGGHIRVTVESLGNEVMVKVQDNGIGIRSEMLSQVFEMFVQADRGLERAQGGLGIGLTLVKQLVEMHGGKVEAHSEGPGRGSAFTVRLPVLEEVIIAPQPQAREEKGIAPKQRILVVDDNQDAATSMGMMLTLLGNEIRKAYDGLEALEVAEVYHPDLILLDIGLPKMNGYEVCRRIRAEPWGKGIGIIACTGWGQEEDIRRAKEAGFQHHLVKPVDPYVLTKLLASFRKGGGMTDEG